MLYLKRGILWELEKITCGHRKKKEKIVLESFGFGTVATARKYDVHKDVLIDWRNKYTLNGFEGLVSQTGRASGNPIVGKIKKQNKRRRTGA